MNSRKKNKDINNSLSKCEIGLLNCHNVIHCYISVIMHNRLKTRYLVDYTLQSTTLLVNLNG
jgi:hypothetical protein